MSRRTTLKYTLAAVAAGTVVAASPAVAKPIDTDRADRFGPVTPPPYQDLRGEQAKEAARNAEKEKFLPGQPTWPTKPAPVAKPAVKPAPAVPASDGGGVDDVWLIVGAGLAAAGIVGGSAAGAARRYRVRARRVAA
jgi:lipoprotein-anchoring transpeptidase ErfK/SrfK